MLSVLEISALIPLSLATILPIQMALSSKPSMPNHPHTPLAYTIFLLPFLWFFYVLTHPNIRKPITINWSRNIYRHIRYFRPSTYTYLRHLLHISPSQTTITHTDIDSICQILTSTIQAALQQYVPGKNINSNHKALPRFILDLIHLKRQLWRHYQQARDQLSATIRQLQKITVDWRHK